MKLPTDPMAIGAIVGASLAVLFTLLTGWRVFEIDPFFAAGTMVGRVAIFGGFGLLIGAFVSFTRKH